MAHGIGIKNTGGQSAAANSGDTSGSFRAESSHPSGALRDLNSRSGTWKITWVGRAEMSDIYSRTCHDLFERQLSTFLAPRVFLLSAVREQYLREIQARSSVVAIGESPTSPSPDFDVVWDAGLLSRVELPERLKLVQTLDSRLKVGGACIVIAPNQRAADGALEHSLLPEEIAAYFFPAYVVARHEEHEFALPPGSPVAFHTLVLVKQSPLTPEMLDVDLHRSLHAVAARRRGLTR